MDLDIVECLSHGLGYSPSSNKWYGWSHRGICGFGIGSKCELGDCHFRASNIDEQIMRDKKWFEEDGYNVDYIGEVNIDGI
jgi:hypothetical protein